MDEETEKELKHSENARLNQDIRLGELAKEILALKNRVTQNEYMLYQLQGRVTGVEETCKRLDLDNQPD